MDDFMELLETNSKQTLQFFVENLDDERVTGTTEAEMFYVAGILAHYAHISRNTNHSLPPASNLYEILDNFVLPSLAPESAMGMEDPEILEIAGSQTLLLVGFFRDQMRRKHNLKWYDHLGQGFFEKASERLIGGKKSHLLAQVAEHFPLWTVSCCKVSRTLREKRYLLQL